MSAAGDERDRVLSEVELAHREAITAGLDVLRRWAATGERFSANDARSELRAAGVTSSAMGALFNAAKAGNIIRPVGLVSSDSLTTHRKAIQQYIGTQVPLSAEREEIKVPVIRDRGGRFTQPTDDDAPVLFDIEVA